VDVTGPWWHWQEQAEGSVAAAWRQRIVEIDKTDPSYKLEHKMNLVLNYFTK
jgi:hypothetical protein